MKPKVSDPVQYVPDDDHADGPLAAIVTRVHPDGRVDLAYWCPDNKAMTGATGVNEFAASDGDTDEPYFRRP